VGDTHAPFLAIVDAGEEHSPSVEVITVPHATRFVVAAPLAGGMWLGSSTHPVVTLVGLDGQVLQQVPLPGIPFGVTVLGDGRVLCALKDEDLLAIVDPEVPGGEVAALPTGDGSMPMTSAVRGDRCYLTLAGSSEIIDFELMLPPEASDVTGAPAPVGPPVQP
jgi:hypothetical protein